MATEQTIVERWLAALSAVTAPIPGDHELATRIVATAALLAGEFPAEAFCRASVAYVAEVCEFFPTYAKAKATLSTWWREHRDETQPAAIAAPPDRLDAMDRLWVKFWQTRMAEDFARSGTPNDAGNRANVAALIRAHAPRAWAAISGVPERSGAMPTAAAGEGVAAALRAWRTPSSAILEAVEARPAARPMTGDALQQARTAAGSGNLPVAA